MTGLEALGCYDCKLTSLNLNGCTNLNYLNIENNQLTSLDLSGLTNLNYLWAGRNQLTTLDIRDCPLLVDIVKVTYKRDDSYSRCTYRKDIDDKTFYYLVYDKNTRLITGKGEIVDATKNTKATVNIGTKYQIDPGDETGNGFASSDKKIATVNSKGLVTPKAVGKCKITFKVGKATRTVTLTVQDTTIPKWVVLDQKGTVAATKGSKVKLTATMSDGAVSKLKWTTSNKKIATVKNGVVSFKKAGTVTITVTTVKGNKKAKVKFKVSK